MMVVMLVAGIGCLLAGLLAIGFGIPVKEFSFGNTLILYGGCYGVHRAGYPGPVGGCSRVEEYRPAAWPGVRLGLGNRAATDSRSGTAAP